MEQRVDALEMLDLMVRPGFCVEDNRIIKANQNALNWGIEPGADVRPLLLTGQEEYSLFQEGCLYLTVSVSGQQWGASVTRMGAWDVFILEQEADQAELRAMALAARELREPLTSVMTTADRLFPVEARIDDEATREQVARINRGLLQMLRVISNMSDANRFASDTDTRQEVRDVQSIFSEITAKATALAEHSGVRVESQIHPEPVYSLVDAEKLERAVYNIVSNALKFTPEGGCIQVSLTRRSDKLYFSVRDEGPGIAENLRSGIFSRYTREPGLEDGRFGIGLGLVLIRSAASLHDGTVLVDHPQGKGTRITMSMTIRPGAGNTLRSPLMKVDYAGEWDHGLLELSDTLPASLYGPQK